MTKKLDLTGQTFGILKVIEPDGEYSPQKELFSKYGIQ